MSFEGAYDDDVGRAYTKRRPALLALDPLSVVCAVVGSLTTLSPPASDPSAARRPPSVQNNKQNSPESECAPWLSVNKLLMGLSFGALAVVVRSSAGGAQDLHGAPPAAKIHPIAALSVLDRALTLVELRSLLLGLVFVLGSFILGAHQLHHHRRRRFSSFAC